MVGGGVWVDWTFLTIFNPEQSSKLLRVVPLGTWVPRYLSSPQVSVGHPPVLLGMSIVVPVGLGLVLDGDVFGRVGGVGGGGGGPGPGGGGGDGPGPGGGVGPGPGGGGGLGPGDGGGGPGGGGGGPEGGGGIGTSGSSTSCSTPSSALLCAALSACLICDLCFLSAQWLYFISQF